MKNNNKSIIETITKVLNRTAMLISPLTMILCFVGMVKEILFRKNEDK